ncbi:hypothetical protein Hamer_G024633, partial [Homarus americanus]
SEGGCTRQPRYYHGKPCEVDCRKLEVVNASSQQDGTQGSARVLFAGTVNFPRVPFAAFVTLKPSLTTVGSKMLTTDGDADEGENL